MPTFADAWNRVHLDVPAADPLQARSWVQLVYQDLCDRYPWHFLRREITLTTLAASTRTATGVTNGSTAVTGAGFVATDVTRQFRVGAGLPWYTIASVVVGVSAILDQVYTAVTNASTTATVFDGYARMPADFGAFEVVYDPTNQRSIVYGVPAHEMMRNDPDRQIADSTPRALVDNLVLTTGIVRYEWWPNPTAAAEFPMLYKARPQTLTNTSLLVGVLGDRTDVLIEGALARAALWPGTVTQRNPYFNIQLAREHRTEFEKKVQSLGLRDDDQALQSYSDFDWAAWGRGGISQTADLLRSTDATVEDYF